MRGQGRPVAKLSDFGLSDEQEQEIDRYAGTCMYRDPQLATYPYTARETVLIDSYAIGVIWLELRCVVPGTAQLAWLLRQLQQEDAQADTEISGGGVASSGRGSARASRLSLNEAALGQLDVLHSRAEDSLALQQVLMSVPQDELRAVRQLVSVWPAARPTARQMLDWLNQMAMDRDLDGMRATRVPPTHNQLQEAKDELRTALACVEETAMRHCNPEGIAELRTAIAAAAHAAASVCDLA